MKKAVKKQVAPRAPRKATQKQLEEAESYEALNQLLRMGHAHRLADYVMREMVEEGKKGNKVVLEIVRRGVAQFGIETELAGLKRFLG